MKMKRQEENKQQNSRAHKAPESVAVVHAGIKPGIEPKQCCFSMSMENNRYRGHRFTLKSWVSLTRVERIPSRIRLSYEDVRLAG